MTKQHDKHDIAPIIDQYGLTAEENEIVKYKLLSMTNEQIAKAMGNISVRTVYRKLADQRIKNVMIELMAVSLTDATVTAGVAVGTAIDLFVSTAQNKQVPLEIRLSAGKMIVDTFKGLSASQREQAVLDLFMEQANPNAVKQIQPATDDNDGAFLLNK